MDKIKFTVEEFENIKRLVEAAICASNKKEAKVYINKLDFYGYKVTGNTCNILNSLVSCVNNASGMVRDKEHWISFVQQELHKLEWYGVEEE